MPGTENQELGPNIYVNPEFCRILNTSYIIMEVDRVMEILGVI